MGDDISEMEDFFDSKDYNNDPACEGYKTGVFWDVGASPFPEGMDPDAIYQKIESALIELGAEPKMSIVAYVDEKKAWWNEFLRKKKTWKSSIFFIPLGPKPSLRMLNDTFLWEIKSPPPANVIFVSDKVRHSDLLSMRLTSMVRNFHYDVHLVEPTTGYGESLVEEWPGSLFDNPSRIEEIAVSETVNPAEPRPAKRREVVEGSED